MAEPGPYLGNDEIQLILDSLQLDDTVEVVWRQRETRDCNASALYTWVGTVVVRARQRVNAEDPEAPKVADIQWTAAPGDGDINYVGQSTRLPEQGIEYFSIKKLRKAARLRLQVVEAQQQQQQQQQQQNGQGQQLQHQDAQPQPQPQQPQPHPAQPQPPAQLDAEKLSKKWEDTGLPVEAILQTTEADFNNLGFTTQEKIMLKTMAAKVVPRNGPNEKMAAAAIGDLNWEDANVHSDDDGDETRELFNPLTQGLAEKWTHNIMYALLTNGKTMNGSLKAEFDSNIKCLKQLANVPESQQAVLTILERMGALHIRAATLEQSTALSSYEAKVAKAKEQVAAHLRRVVPFAAILREIVANDKKTPRKTPGFFRRRQGRPYNNVQPHGTQQQVPGPNQQPPAQKNICRQCNGPFTGPWHFHAATCPALH